MIINNTIRYIISTVTPDKQRTHFTGWLMEESAFPAPITNCRFQCWITKSTEEKVCGCKLREKNDT